VGAHCEGSGCEGDDDRPRGVCVGDVLDRVDDRHAARAEERVEGEQGEVGEQQRGQVDKRLGAEELRHGDGEALDDAVDVQEHRHGPRVALAAVSVLRAAHSMSGTGPLCAGSGAELWDGPAVSTPASTQARQVME